MEQCVFFYYINFLQVALINVDQYDLEIMNDLITRVPVQAVKIDRTDADYLAEIEILWLAASVVQPTLMAVGDFPPMVRERLLEKTNLSFYMVKVVEDNTADNCLTFQLTNKVITDNYTLSSNTEGGQPNKGFYMEYDTLSEYNIGAIALNWFFDATSNKSMKRITVKCRNGAIDEDFRKHISYKRWPSATHTNYEKIVVFRSIEDLQAYYNVHFNDIIEYNTFKMHNMEIVKLKEIDQLQLGLKMLAWEHRCPGNRLSYDRE